MFYSHGQHQKHLQQLRQSCTAPHSQACALPLSSYIDSAIFEIEQQKVFASDWLFVCPSDKLQPDNSYFACLLSGEPVVIIRDENAELRALSNSCRHRGTPLFDLGFGKLEGNISCPYHAWSYAKDGRFQGAPMCKKSSTEAKDHSLVQFQVEIFLGLIFVNFDQRAPSLHQRCKHIEPYTQLFGLESFKYSCVNPSEYWQCNWKIAFENAAESYHLFKVHPQTLEKVSPSKHAYYVAGNASATLTGGALTLSMLDKLWLSGTKNTSKHYLLLALPPSIVMVINHDSLSWISVNPLNSEHSRIDAGFISAAKDKAQSSSELAFTQAFIAEDKAICERLQMAAKSRFNPGGQLVGMEQVLADFHHYLGERLFAQPAPPFTVNRSEQNPFQL